MTDDPKAVILGDMAELGAFAAEEHDAVLAQLAGSDIGWVYLVGPQFEVHILESNDAGKLLRNAPHLK